MASVPTVDIDAILKPISGDKPCGVDPRDGLSFELLKEARREEDAASQGDWKRDVKVADWSKAIQLATQILATEGKDLQVAVWLTEALVKRYGSGGLRDGLKILRELHEQYWDSFYPLVEDGDLDFRGGRLEALNKLLPVAIECMPLIQPPGGPAYGYVHRKQALEVENLRRGAATDGEMKRALAEALDEGKIDKEKFDKAVAATPLSYCSTILENLNQSEDECKGLQRVLDDKYGHEPPNLRLIKEAVHECWDFMNDTVKDKGGVTTPILSQSELTSQEAAMAPVVQMTSSGSGIMPADRADALRRLGAVAEFFRRTEPHSPVAYLVQRAARWGEMPLEEWLQEVIKSDDVLVNVRETLGLTQGGSPNEQTP